MSTALTPVKEIQQSLVKMQDNFKAALPEHIPAERFIAVAQTALVNNPNIANLDRQSVYQAFMQAAQDGLMPDGRECAIVPYGGKARYTPMIGGITKKVRNSGEVGTIDAQVVYEKDTYEAWVDEKGPHFRHVRAKGDRGAIVLTYAYALGKDGSVYFEEVSEEQMQKIRAMSKAKDSPWNGSFADEMRRKSALRRLAKYRLPNSSDMSLQDVLKRDDELYDEETAEESATETTRPSRLGAIIEAQAVAEPAAMTTEDVQEVFPEATVVKPKPSPAPAPAPSGKIIQCKIEKLTAKDGEKDGKPWRRFDITIGGMYYGTFDTKINDVAVAAVDAGQEVQVEFKERQVGGKVFRDIVSLVAVAADDDEGIPI